MKYFSTLRITVLLLYCCTISCNCGKHCSHRDHHHDAVKGASTKTLALKTTDAPDFYGQFRPKKQL